MSKKILKRSLALGALMAFVITGSAMAAVAHPLGWAKWEDIHDNGGDLNYWQPYTAELSANGSLDGDLNEDTRVYTFGVTDGVYTLDTQGKAVSFNGVNQHEGADNYNPNHKFHNTNLNGNKLIINYDGSGAAVDCGTSYGNHFHWSTTDPDYPHIDMALPGFKFYTEGESKKGDLEINAGNGIAIGGHGDIDVNTLKITASTSNAINSNPNGINSDAKYDDVIDIERVRKGIVINANDVEINLTNGVNVIQAYNQVTIGSEEDAVDRVVIKGNYERAIRVTDSTTKIYADTFNLDGATKSSRVDNNGSLELTVNKDGIIKNQYHSASKGAIDVTLGSGVEWTGKFVTDDNATKGALNLSGTWNLKDIFTDLQNKTNSLTEATFRKGSTFVIDGATYEYNDAANATNVYALNGVGDAKLKVEDNAQIQVTNIKNATYNIATGFKTIEANNYWDVLDLTNVMQATWDKAENNDLKLVISAKGADAMEDSVAPEGSGEMVSEIITEIGNVENISELPEETQAAAKFIQDAVVGNDDVTAKNIISNALQMAEAGGNSGTAVTVANNVSSVTTGRMGFSATPSAQKGGNGVGLLAEDSGAAIWAQYVHGKDSVEDMPMSGGATSYEGQFNGVVMGVDFKKVGKFQSGVAFNYGEGDTNSVGNRISTHSDYDFWGVGYYGNIRNDDTNFIFDVNYAKSESDVEQDNGGTTLEASPETTTWSAGVKVEKLYQNNNVQIVPYTGLRFMSVDTDSYKATNGTDTLFNYAPERQDIWLLPLGVSIKQEVTNANGWTVTPKVDLSYIWAFGDTDSEMTVAIPGVSSTSRLGYTVMDDESWLGVVGLEAAKGDWTFGVSYSYQKGDHSENEKWYVDAKYSF